MRHIWCLAVALFGVSALSAAPITIDSFTDAGSSLNGSGLTQNVVGSTNFSDSGLSGVLGGTRGGQLSMASFQQHGDVNLKLTGAGLMYNSGNGSNIADGSFTLTYDGAGGFPANFAANTGITLQVKSQNNPAAATQFTVQLVSGATTYTSAVQTLVGNSNGDTITFLFSGFDNNLLSSGALGNISSVRLLVDPNAGTNLVLSGFGTSGVGGGGGGNGGPDPVPEPASLALFGGLAVSGLLFFRRRKAAAAA